MQGWKSGEECRYGSFRSGNLMSAGVRAKSGAMFFLGLVLWLSASICAWAQSGQDLARVAGDSLVGKALPSLRFVATDGQVIDLDALRGRKAVYLKFWATWCVTCREQLPHLKNVYRMAGDDLAVVAINIGLDDTPAQIAAYRKEHGLMMPIVRDDDGRLGELFGLRVTPQHVVIDKGGRIAYVGHLADAALERALAAARKATVAATDIPPSLPNLAPELRTLSSGDAVPVPKMSTLEGVPVSLSDPERKRATVLAFISPWCEGYLAKSRPKSSKECIALRQQLVSFGRDNRVRWLGIASGLWASERDLRKYRNKHQIPAPLTLDQDDGLFRQFGIRKIPAVVVVGADGRILSHLEPGPDGRFDFDTLLEDEVDGRSEPLLVEDAFAPSAHFGPDGSLLIDWKIAPGYYLYRDRFSLVSDNASTAIGALQWSVGKQHRDPQFGQVTVFYDKAQLRVSIRKSALPERLDLEVTYQGCQEGGVCYPPTKRHLSVDVPGTLRHEQGTWGRWLIALAAAFAGGLVLNLMPCVLPVLSLKVLSVLEAGDDAGGARRGALAYAAGTALSFSALGLVILVLRVGGAAVDWGAQMQQPVVVALLALVMVAVGLSLSGVIHPGAGLAGISTRYMRKPGLGGEFLTGVLACVVASPCTAPFMGTAIAFAFATESVYSALPIFLALGIGVAAPMLAVAFIPAMSRWLPRPGAWMETLKQLLAFPMYGAAIWLLWVLGKQRGVDALTLTLLAGLFLSLGLWWYERHRFAAVKHRVFAVLVMAVAIAPLSFVEWNHVPAAEERALPKGAERFTSARLQKLLAQGTPVFVNVTADWCLTCKANESSVLGRDAFQKLLANTGTAYLVADYTEVDPGITALLQEHRAVGIPLYLHYASNADAEILPTVLTLGSLTRALSSNSALTLSPAQR